MSYSTVIVDLNLITGLRTIVEWNRYFNQLEEDRLKEEGTCLKDLSW
jgi:hypothetical protein